MVGEVRAATATNTFRVELAIVSACDITTVAPTDVDFGSRPSTATNLDSQGSLNVRCTVRSPYSIALDAGRNGADVNSRKMLSGTDLVPYQLYRSAARTAADIWGSTIGTGGNVLSGTGTGLVQAIPVFGRVPSANFPAGVYSDRITASITY
jgi:spore coat protein U-like protein